MEVLFRQITKKQRFFKMIYEKTMRTHDKIFHAKCSMEQT